ncbi:MAG: YgjV family protein [Candidatus Saccharibacteria bacterium]|nr:YgjV family protein [Candidatus Saccharibacteria bacterium]
MEIDIRFIIAQGLSIIGWLFLVYSYYKDDIQKLLKLQIVTCTLETLSYFMLGATAGIFACILDLVKVVLYYKFDKDMLVFLVTLPLYGVLMFFSIQEEGMISLLPAIGGIIDGFVLTRNKTVATAGTILASTLWIIYDIITMAYAAAATDTILVISNFFVLFLGYSRILHIDKLHVIKCHYLSRSISANILALDHDVYAQEYLWTIDEQKNTFNLNPDSIMLIRDKKHTVGYINYITITEEEYERIKRAQTFYQNISPKDITSLRRRRKNYLLLESVCISKSYESQKMADFVSKHLRRMLRYKRGQGINVHGILSVAISDFEKTFMDTIGATHLKDYREGESLYELDETAVSRYVKGLAPVPTVDEITAALAEK